MDRGYTHVDIFDDAPVAVPTAAGMWTPQNYDGKYSGPVTLRTGVAMSLNTVSVRATTSVGVDAITRTMRSLGVESDIPPHVSIALGTPDLTLIEVVSGYAAFANGGKRVDARYVDFVTDDAGRVVEDYREERPSEQAISPQLAYLTTDLLRTVVRRGTAWRAKRLERPVAGKTGTSTGWRDAWFVGYTTDLLTGVWVGRDDFKPIGVRATGGGVALPIWLQLMKAAHPDTAPSEFPVPDDIIFARANEYSGRPAYGEGSPWVPFARGTVPPLFKRDVELRAFAPTPPP
jgi:penicillin-binding protein 1A